MAQGVIFDPAAARLISLLAAAAEGLRTVHRWRNGDARCRGDHVHHIPTFYLCLRGTARVLGGPDGRLDLAAGEALALAPGVLHGHEPGRDAAELDLGQVGRVCDFVLRSGDTGYWCRVRREPFATLCANMVATDAAGKRLALGRNLLRELASERIEAMEQPHPAVQRMARLLFANPPGLDAQRLLAASGIGARRAHDLFRSFFSCTPKAAISDQRLALAAACLVGGAAVGTAARQAGFTRRQDLTRAWKRRHGTPPQHGRQPGKEAALP